MFICHVYFIFCKLPVPLHHLIILVDWGFFLIVLQRLFIYYGNKSFVYIYVANIFTQVVICLLTLE